MNHNELKERWKQEEAIAHIHGWDFSHIDDRYEEEQDIPWDYESLIRQYLHHETVVKEFAAYYELYRKYERDYSPIGILKGEASTEMLERVRNAPFDERILLSSMLSARMLL